MVVKRSEKRRDPKIKRWKWNVSKIPNQISVSTKTLTFFGRWASWKLKIRQNIWDTFFVLFKVNFYSFFVADFRRKKLVSQKICLKVKTKTVLLDAIMRVQQYVHLFHSRYLDWVSFYNCIKKMRSKPILSWTSVSSLHSAYFYSFTVSGEQDFENTISYNWKIEWFFKKRTMYNTFHDIKSTNRWIE